MFLLSLWLLLSLMTLLALCFLWPLRTYKKTTFFLSIFFVSISITFYFCFGSSQKLSAWYVQQRQEKAILFALKQFGSIANLTHALEIKMQQNPNDWKGWYLLGKLYLGQNRLNEAEKAFERAYSLKTHPHPPS